MSTSRLPVAFISHGGGPMPLLKHPTHADLVRSWAPSTPLWNLVHDKRVSTVVMVSAHYISQKPGTITVQYDPGNSGAGNMFYDYGGFPPESYKIKLPNASNTAVADRIVSLLGKGQIQAVKESGRGYDHGTFVPLVGLALPPEVSVVQISICPSFQPAFHRKVGRLLNPLRSEGVLLLGSGMSSHNMAATRYPKKVTEFHAALKQCIQAGKIDEWESVPHARLNHRNEDHLVPLFVLIGAAEAADKESLRKVQSLDIQIMDTDIAHYILD